ncbi:MAG: Rieske 2Fe-2S domain-containing protein [Actinomycetota bacterium]
MLETLAIVAAGLGLTLVVAALAGRWWLRRLVTRPVPAAALAGGGPGGCAGCPQTALMAAQGGGSSGQGAATQGEAGEASGGRRGPSRRTFLRGALGVSALGAVGGFGTATLAYLWPDVRGGFGAVLEVDTEEAILEEIDANDGRFEYPPGRALLVRYDPDEDPEGQYADITDGGQARVLALYQVCVHLGCAVPWCSTSQWWECPCHGSQYNRWGEWMSGPAARGLDRFRVEIADDGTLLLDTSEIVTGPSRGAQTLEQPPQGPHCT